MFYLANLSTKNERHAPNSKPRRNALRKEKLNLQLSSIYNKNQPYKAKFISETSLFLETLLYLVFTFHLFIMSYLSTLAMDILLENKKETNITKKPFLFVHLHKLCIARKGLNYLIVLKQ